MAYFPLSGEELGSITLPALNGTNVGELAWVDDAKFARVPNCEKVRAQSQGGPRRQAGRGPGRVAGPGPTGLLLG